MPFIVDTSVSNPNGFLDLPFTYTYPTTHSHGHARSSSHSSVYSVLSNTDSINTALTTPPPALTPQHHQRRSTPPVRQHGPLLLPKIRSQDQDLDAGAVVTPAQLSRASSLM